MPEYMFRLIFKQENLLILLQVIQQVRTDKRESLFWEWNIPGIVQLYGTVLYSVRFHSATDEDYAHVYNFSPCILSFTLIPCSSCIGTESKQRWRPVWFWEHLGEILWKLQYMFYSLGFYCLPIKEQTQPSIGCILPGFWALLYRCIQFCSLRWFWLGQSLAIFRGASLEMSLQSKN